MKPSYYVDYYKRGPQVQYERAERAMQRLAEMTVELQQKARAA